MRLRRLMLVRAAILRTDGVSAKIGNLARACGFTAGPFRDTGHLR
jgi:hypothetical protein